MRDMKEYIIFKFRNNFAVLAEKGKERKGKKMKKSQRKKER